MLNESIRYQNDALFIDAVPITDIIAQVGTPAYVYSLPRALANLGRVRRAFDAIHPEIHFSVKANGCLSVLRGLVEAGAGMDVVSGGEIFRALAAGAQAEQIVFAGVGKTPNELAYALRRGVGWINVENTAELQLIDSICGQLERPPARVALRLNPDVEAATHRHIATGHKGAKFGLSIDAARGILADQGRYPQARIKGLHVHIGSQLHDTEATRRAIETALELAAPYPQIDTLNLGGGLPVPYRPDEAVPTWEEFGGMVAPLAAEYKVILEPGRSIIADAGMLVTSVLYSKQQGGENLLIVDASMAELIRPALYEAHHAIVPARKARADMLHYAVVGPVCESSDVLGRDVLLPKMEAGELLAVLTTGAYGMVMASNYNQRPRPPEVVVEASGRGWHIARRRESWEDLIRNEIGWEA